MPTSLPVRTTAKPAANRKDVRQGAEGIEVWAICVGLAATILASFIYFSSGDQVGAALILLLATVVVFAMLRASDDSSQV